MNKVVDEGGDLRRYRTELPNMVDDMGLSVYAFRLYVHLKRVAGDKGLCWQGTKTLATACRMSEGKVSAAKQELVSAGLIAIRRPHGPTNHADEILIRNVWPQNFAAYATPSPHEQTPSHNEDPPSCGEHPPSPHETKKELLEEVTPKKNNTEDAPKRAVFVRPDMETVQAYFDSKEHSDYAHAFFAYYQSNGWRVGRNPMQDWHASASGWISRENQKSPRAPTRRAGAFEGTLDEQKNAMRRMREGD